MKSHDHAHGHSLAEDLATMREASSGRRQTLRWLLAGAGVAALPLAGCGGGSSSETSTASTSTGTTSTSTTTGTTTTTPGTSTTPTNGSCSVIPEDTGGPYPGDGTNSNSSGVVNVLTQLGVVRSDIRSSFNGMTGTAAGVPLTIKLQAVDANGSLTFQTIFPGCYSGRMPHVHFEVYPSLAKSTSAANRIKTSQFTFPMATLNE